MQQLKKRNKIMTYTENLRNFSNEQALQAYVAHAVRQGWVVQSSSPNQYILTKNKRIGWFWNSLAVIVTSGLWLIPVVYWALNRKQQTRLISINNNGQIYDR
jgi:plastocyanin domain-containing protein